MTAGITAKRYAPLVVVIPIPAIVPAVVISLMITVIVPSMISTVVISNGLHITAAQQGGHYA